MLGRLFSYLYIELLFKNLDVMVSTTLNTAWEFQDDECKTLYDQSVALAEEECYEEALRKCNQALVVQPDSHRALVFRGVILMQLGYYKAAIASCEKALAISPSEKQAWIVRGAALNQLGHYKQSYASYDRALGIQRQSGWQKLTQVLKVIFKPGSTASLADKTTTAISI